MKKINQQIIIAAILIFMELSSSPVLAVIPGNSGTTFDFIAKQSFIYAGDGLTLDIWGYGISGSEVQYPGPTLILQEGDYIVINLTNELPVPVSMVFPGIDDVSASGGVPGLLTHEALPGGTVSYTFTASRPGTFSYHSGTETDLQIELGLFGAIIVRPALGAGYAYNNPGSQFDREYLFLISEMDLDAHILLETGNLDLIDTTAYFPVFWFINGRNFPDTMAPDFSPILPAQPYSCAPRMHPGERILLRFVGGGHDMHPFHTHGNHMEVIARNGQLLESSPGAGPDQSEFRFTETVIPGQTTDAIFTWTGTNLGWDIYGHEQDRDNLPLGNFPGSEDIDHNGNNILDNVDLAPFEDPNDHGKPFPITMPDINDLTLGENFSGSPFLGAFGYLPPDHPRFNLSAGYFFIWHSHNEKEMVNNDIFPGGCTTMMTVEHPDVEIP